MYSSDLLEAINCTETVNRLEVEHLISGLFQQDVCDILDDYEAAYGDRVIY